MGIFGWGVLPYATALILVGGLIWRYRYDQFGWTTRSSQLYESRLLDEGVIDPHILAVRHDKALVRGSGVPVEAVGALHQQGAARLLQLLALAVIDGLGKLGRKQADARQLLLEIAGRIGPHLAAGKQQYRTHQ